MAEMTKAEWEEYIKMLIQGAPPASPVYRKAVNLDELKGMPAIQGSTLTPSASTIPQPIRTSPPVETPNLDALKGFPAVPGSALATKEETPRAIDPRDLISPLDRLGKPAMKEGPSTALLRQEDPFAKKAEAGEPVSISSYPTGEMPDRLRRIFDFAGSTNKALAKADEEKRLRMMESMKGLGEGLDLIGRGMAGAKGHMYPEEFRPAGMEQLSRDIEREEDKITPQEAQMLMDGFGIQVEPGMPWSRVSRALPAVAQAVRMRSSMQLAQQKATEKQTKEKNDAKIRAFEFFQQQPGVRAALVAINDSSVIAELLQRKTGASDRAALTKVPRMMGEVGNMSTFDVKRHEQRMGLLDKLKDFTSQKFEGKLSDSHRAQLLQMVADLKRTTKAGLNYIARYHAKARAPVLQSMGVTEDEILEMLLYEGAPEEGATEAGEIPIENMIPLRDKTTGKLMWWYPENEGDTWDRTKYEEVE